jgi:hypothetical protein
MTECQLIREPSDCQLNMHTFEDKEPAFDLHPDASKSSYDGVSVVQPNQISDTQDIGNEYYHLEQCFPNSVLGTP